MSMSCNFVSKLIELATKSHCRQQHTHTHTEEKDEHHLELVGNIVKMKLGIVISAIVGMAL